MSNDDWGYFLMDDNNDDNDNNNNDNDMYITSLYFNHIPFGYNGIDFGKVFNKEIMTQTYNQHPENKPPTHQSIQHEKFYNYEKQKVDLFLSKLESQFNDTQK